MAAFRRKKQQRAEEGHLVKCDFDVAGASHHQEDFLKLAVKNDKEPAPEGYDRVYLYNFIHSPVELIPYENTFKVIINNVWVGNIRVDDAKEVSALLKKREIMYISSWIRSGPSILYENGQELGRDRRDIYASVRIAYVEE